MHRIRRPVVIGIILGAVLVSTWCWILLRPRPPNCRAEVLLLMRPTCPAVLNSSFRRELRSSVPKVVQFEVSNFTLNKRTLAGGSATTNAIVRLVVAAFTPSDALKTATEAGRQVAATLSNRWGAEITRVQDPVILSRLARNAPGWKAKFGDTKQGPFPVEGPTVWPTAKISVDVGREWDRHYILDDQRPFLSLTGTGPCDGASILFSVLSTNTTSTADVVAHFASKPKTPGLITTPIVAQGFVATSGVAGVHLHFEATNPAGPPKYRKQFVDTFVVTNAGLPFSTLLCTSLSEAQSDQIKDSVLQTLSRAQ
jgi:hypothetical protein